jgi:SAM-dependent methyltransferase
VTDATGYYAGKETLLADLFGAVTVEVHADHVVIDGRVLPVVEDVIITVAHDRLPPRARAAVLPSAGTSSRPGGAFAPDVQASFGQEWERFDAVLPEHVEEFAAYFDLVDLGSLGDARVADLGCGMGRWAAMLASHVDTIVLVDFSDAIFVARRNLVDAGNAVFVLGDVLDLPFRDDAFDFAYCLGVAHHLPVDALDVVRDLARLAPRLLVYLYYALDNRPAFFRAILHAVTAVRTRLSRVRSRRIQDAAVWLLTLGVYLPLAVVGRIVGPRLRRVVPLAETYSGKSVLRIRQDVHDRFLTSIEQRFTRDDIRGLERSFSSVTISDGLPYWHFVCER